MNAKKSINPIKPGSLAKWTLIALLFGGVGLQIVYLKNQQFQLGQKIRQTEQQIREVHFDNQRLLTEIALHSSRSAIQKKLVSQATSMMPVQDQCIIRFSLPAMVQGEVAEARTPSREKFIQ